MKTQKDWDFDTVIDRRNTGSVKWDPGILRKKFGEGRENLCPLWVADMDFYAPSVVARAMKNRMEHQIYGYTTMDPAMHDAMISWYKRRHQWEIKKDWILTSPGVVPSTNFFIQRFTQPGDKVLIQTPVYYPFAQGILQNGRRIAENPLKIKDNMYQMDFEDLAEKAADPKVKTAILCSPHNPVGRVWTEEELKKFGKICIENNVLILSDEIHCDLIMPGSKHICFQTISDEFAEASITANAASKTFNLAGLHQSNLIIPNEHLRKEFSRYFQTLGFGPQGSSSLFGAIAASAAYSGAEPWLDDLLGYLYENYLYMKKHLEQSLPAVKVYPLEGTYLAWIDFRPLGHSPEEIIRIIEEKAGLALDHGNWFGENGAGFERLNLACPRSVVKKAVDSLMESFRS